MTSTTGRPWPLAVVVLNWNGRDDTVACVRSVLADGLPQSAVVVVDNGSTDNIADALAFQFPQVRLLQNGANLGFAGGMNRGVTYALDRGADYICILNNDTLVRPGMFAELMLRAGANAAVSPEVRYMDRPEMIWFGAGAVEADRCWPRHLTPDETRAVDAKKPQAPVRESDTLAGCCILASGATWRKVGMLDEAYFLIYEDADWSARATALGVPLLVARHAVLLHAVSASFAGPGRFLASFYYARNGRRYGRSYCSSFKWSRTRFIRDQLVRPNVRKIRSGQLIFGLTESTFLVAGIVADFCRRYGPAPACVQSAARRSSPVARGVSDGIEK